MKDLQVRLKLVGSINTVLYRLRSDMLTQRVNTSVSLPAMDMLLRLIDYAVWGSPTTLYAQIDAFKRNAWFLTHEEDVRNKWLKEVTDLLDEL